MSRGVKFDASPAKPQARRRVSCSTMPPARRRPMIIAFSVVLLAIAAGLYAFTLWQVRVIEARFPPQGQFVSVGGGRLHLAIREPQGSLRATILLLHGATGNERNMMAPLAAPLAERGFRVIGIDRPGHGWSDRIEGRAASSPAVQARLIVEGLKTIGVTHAIVLGHSLAGAVATNFALDQRDFTDGLVLVSPVTHPWPGGIAAYYKVSASPVTGPLFNNLIALPAGMLVMEKATASIFTPQNVPETFAADTAAALVLRPAEFRANSEDVTDLEAFVTQQAPRLPEIKVPVAIVSGDHDGVVYTHIHSEGSLRAIAGATLKLLPGVGHAPHFTNTADVVAAAEEVADRINQRKTTPSVMSDAVK